jgi:hypothetical protein
VLETQIDYFSLGEKAGQRYYDALADIAVAAKSVFGKHIDTTFIEDNKELIMDLSKGGEAASAAWEELTKLSFDNWLKLSGLTGKARDDI